MKTIKTTFTHDEDILDVITKFRQMMYRETGETFTTSAIIRMLMVAGYEAMSGVDLSKDPIE